MTVKKQPESNPGKLHEDFDDWLRQFQKHLELFMLQTAQSLPPDSDPSDFRVVALRAVKLALLDSGVNAEQLQSLFGLVAFEESGLPTPLEWNAQLNSRRFALIDQEIQGTLADAGKLELAALTQQMRMAVDSELNLPMEGARKLHRLLTEGGSSKVDSAE